MRASQLMLVVKNLPANVGDVKDASLVPGSGKFSRGGHGRLLQYSCLENPTNRGIDRLQSLGSQADTIEET